MLLHLGWAAWLVLLGSHIASDWPQAVKTAPDGLGRANVHVLDGKGGVQEAPINVDHAHLIRMPWHYSSIWNRGYRGSPGAELAWAGIQED